jgi:hypothetical protein
MKEKEDQNRQGNAAMVTLIPANSAHRFHGVVGTDGAKQANFVKRPKTN